MTSSKTIEEALCWANQELVDGDSPKLDGRVLLSHVLQCNTTYLLTWSDKSLNSEQIQAFQDLVARRKAGEPIAYIVGTQEFWSLPLRVNNSTLIPRPETELLVEITLSLLLPEQCEMLDLGTGTGAIALVLAHEKSLWNVTGVDRVSEAVLLANQNKAELGLSNVNFIESHWFSSLSNKTYDLIVTNPPYVEQHSPYLQQGDVRFEPKSALTAGEDGLDDIRLIIQQSKSHLNEGGYVLIEHGYGQAEEIRAIFANHAYKNIRTEKDLAGLDRVTLAQM